MTGAIFTDTRPAIIIKSDWRGEPRNTSAPNRAMSYREEAIDIISIAQHARPNDIGQIELRRAQFTTLSSDANRIPSSFRKFASCPGCSSVTPFASSTDMASGVLLETFCTPATRKAIGACGPADRETSQRGRLVRARGGFSAFIFNREQFDVKHQRGIRTDVRTSTLRAVREIRRDKELPLRPDGH